MRPLARFVNWMPEWLERLLALPMLVIGSLLLLAGGYAVAIVVGLTLHLLIS